LAAASFTYLAEALSTFEMTQRSYWEAKHHADGRLRVAVLAHALDGLGPSEVIKRVDALLDQLDTGELASMATTPRVEFALAG
jgi:hypothetical protein